jgi:glucan 1,4-alpha-glucosidase
MSRRLLGVALAAAALGCTATTAHAATPATDGPGAMSHFDLARKDCVGTARNTRSKVWFTVANGVLSDVYYPTNDNTNNETLQYVVTDGSTFTDLQTRDMTYTVTAPDDRAPTCRVTATAKSGRYQIVTDYLTDPHRNTVLMHTRFVPLRGKRSDYKLYVRFDPTLNGNGGGTPNAGADSGTVATNAGHQVLVGSDPVTTTNAANRDYGQPVFSALDSDDGFLEVSNGFAGQPSDGLTQLDAAHKLTADTTDAANGNLVQTARIDLSRWDDFTLALGFGSDQATALAAAHDSLRKPLYDIAHDYADGWHRYNCRLVAPRRPHGVSGRDWDGLLDEYYTSADYVKAAEDKTFPGAEAAALTSPWGQAVAAGDPNNPGTYFGSYREVFARDLYEAWTSMFLAGDRRTARDMTEFLFERQQQADGSMPRNSLTNGKPAPDSFNNQLDEDSYPLIMALAVGLTDHDFYMNHIAPEANFVAAHGPIGGPERWEEQDGYSPSTISAEIAGLLAAAEIADRNRDGASAKLWRGVADEFQRHLKQWTLTTNGPLSAQPYFIRLSKTGDPNAAVQYNVGNGGPTLDQRSVIDAGFLEYARLGIFKPSDQDIVNSLPVVDATIAKSTASGQGFLRYNGDGYGDGFHDTTGLPDGHPWAPGNKGTGHVWPVLSGERGEYEVSRGQLSAAVDRLRFMRNTAAGVGLIPEQAWDAPDLAASPFGTDPTVASIGFKNGKPAGSAAALTWSAGQYVRLMLDVSAAKVLDRPSYTVKRYIDHTQGTTALTVTAPANRSAVTGSTTITGTAAPGAAIVVRGVNLDDHTAVTGTATAAQDGSFSIPLTLTGGTTVINTVATDKHGGTARDVRSVVFDFAPGTLLFSADDPDGDDNGPGNYAYPTSDNFKPGAYDLEQFQVYDDVAGGRIIFRVKTRDLTPTFGSPLGAQLVDVYVHIPGQPATTASSFQTPTTGNPRQYTIDSSGAWSRLIEVQGFGQRYVDSSNQGSLGQVDIKANDVSRYITFSVSKASLGQPVAGWGFTVVLTGQDGFSSDQARGFQPTPQDFQFGVCAPTANLSDPHCTFNPGAVPKAMDVFTPAGTAQSTELDYTQGPVVLKPVVMP